MTTSTAAPSITTMDEAIDYAARLPKLAPAASPPSVPDLCAAWGAAKPIVTFLLALPFIPTRIKTPILALLSILNAMCP